MFSDHKPVKMKGLALIIFLSTVELKPENADEVRRNFDALHEVLKVTQFLESHDKTLGELYYLNTLADWNYSTNITEANDLATRAISKKLREYEAEAFKVADAFDKTLLEDHPDLLRMLKQVGAKSLPEAEAQDLEGPSRPWNLCTEKPRSASRTNQTNATISVR